MTIKALFPTVRPTLNLDFAKTKALDPRITFTRASTATFVGADGLVQTAASGAARFDHNPTTGESLGLLVEEARTNIALYSEQFDNAAWSKTVQNAALAPVVTPNNAVAPDGNFTADKVVFETTGTTNADRSRLRSTATANPGTTTAWTFSIWARTSDGTTHSNLGILINNADLVTMTNVSPQWKRFTCTRTNTSFNDPEIRLAGNAATYAEVHLWGAQVEVGAFPTSYIPTTTATVTRAADVASITGTNFSSWFNSGVGTFFTDSSNDQLTSNIARSAYNQFNTVAFSLGSGSGRVYTPILGYLENNTIYASLFQYNGVGTEWGPFLQNTIPNTANVRKVAVFTDTTNNVAGLCTAGQINVASKPVDPTRTGMLSYSLAQSMVIGYNSNYYGNYMGRIKRLAYYPVRLTDTQLQALTAT